MKTLFCRVVLVCLAVLLIAGASYSQTQINGAASGNWSSTGSWSPATVPNNSGPNTYNVTLLSSPAVNITLDISPTIDTLTLDSGSILSTDSGTTLTTTGVTNGGDIEFYNGNTLTVNGSMTTSNYFDLDRGSKLVVTGNLTNSGVLYTNIQDGGGAANTITVDGTFANNSGATAHIGYFGNTADVMNVGTLSNNGLLYIDTGATLNLTNQANGVTDVVAGSELDVYGTFKAGTANGLAKLNSVEGVLVIGNGQTFTDTPGSGTLTNSGTLDLEDASNMTVSGNLTNSGVLESNIRDQGLGKTNTLTVTGTFTNNSGATTQIGYFGNTTDVMNVATLVNNGFLDINTGATLNLTSQPNGVTDVIGGSELDVYGTLKAGTANGLAKLNSVEGTLVIGNGQTLADTPGSGTLTISSSGVLDLEEGSSMTVSGNLTNSGVLESNIRDQETSGHPNTLTITGTFTNSSGATTRVGYFGNTTDVMNVATLVNNGFLGIYAGATLNLTSQPNGVTDVAAGSELDVYGTFKAGTANALAKLGSIEGTLVIANGQTFTDTPGGTLTNSGTLDLELDSNVTVSGNLTNSGALYTNIRDSATGTTNTLTVTGAFTNNSGATTHIGYFGNTSDVMNVFTLVNNGILEVDAGATLNLTGQPGGLTDVVAGSQLDLFGTFKAGANNGLAKLGSVEGLLVLGNGQTTTVTPGTGPLTISSVGEVDLELGSTLTVDGSLTNSGQLYTNIQDREGGPNNITVTGTFTNSGTTKIGFFDNTTDVINVGVLSNSSAGVIDVDAGATFNITSAGTATNNGTIDVGDTNGAGTFKINGATTLTGTTGKVVLSNFAGNIIGGTGILTNVKNTISGSGNIGNGTMGLNNQGTIDADQSVPLIINAAGTVSNSLTMEATNGATLQLDAGTYTQTTAGNILASETGNLLSAVNLESGVIINGGKLTTTGTTATINLVGTGATLTLNGVSISGNGSVQLADGSTTTLLGTNTNTGTIDLNSTGDTTTLKIGAAAVSLTGTGKIILASNGMDVITGTSGQIFTTGNTIEGPGSIGDGVIGLVNTGTIETVAHQTGETIIDAGSAGFNNQGTVEAVAATTVYINNTANQFLNFNSSTMTLAGGTYIVDGTLEFDGANIVTNNASITLSGAASKLVNQSNANGLANLATNNGTFAIASGRNFTTIGNFTNNGTLNVGGGTKFIVGALAADNLTNYSSNTLTGGTYIVTGTLQFDNEGTTGGIITNDASITLSGTAAKIIDQSSVSMIANLATNASGATFQVTSGNIFTTAGNFTNNGTLIVGSTTSKFVVNTADSLTNFSGGTLTGGTYDLTGVLQFAGDIVTNDANITLTGTSAKILDASGGNSLATFATNAAGASFQVTGGNVFTTGGNFTNNGTLTVGSTTSKFIVDLSDGLTNFNSGTNTLTGGTYNLTGVLQFAGANIVNNAANITLTGTSSAIDNSTGGNGLANFANNTSTGSFTLAGNRTFTTVGAFTNAGAMIINKGSTFTVTGSGNNYVQSSGSTTVDGTLTVNAASMVDITGGNLFGATGNINGNVDLTGGVVNPGDGANLIGELKITGTYTQGSAGAATIDLGGKTAITQYSVLDITKAASLSGTLNVNLVNGFVPTVGTTFNIIDYLSDTGMSMFTTTNLPTVSGDHWTITYGAKDVVLTLVAGPGPAVVVDNLTSDPTSSTAAPITVSASPARRVSRSAGVLASLSSTHEPIAILSRVTCFAARLLGSASCGDHSVATTASALGAVHNNVMPASSRSTLGSVHNNVMPASAGFTSGAAHNNVMVATRSISATRGGASNESSASASAMARLYVCAYLPSSMARTMGCSN